MDSPLPTRVVTRVVSELLDEDGPPFALLRRRLPGRPEGVDEVEVLTGPVQRVERLDQLPLTGPGALALVPYRQIRERGFTATDDGTPLLVLRPSRVRRLPVDALLGALPRGPVTVTDGAFDLDDQEYARRVRRVVDEEIGTGQGANFVLRRTFHGTLRNPDRERALTLFGRLLSQERGAYWTFVVHTGSRILVGASPEAHVRMSGGTVVMNPISGTYRYPPTGPTVDGLLDFLDDRKESEELSMVVDEELKMMCDVGDRGGVVVGPRLREMSQLAHTEYELRGRSSLDVREVLRRTLFAATVTGSPLENACRVIARHESGGRGYYAGALALLGLDRGGAQRLDSPILIRTVDVDTATGRLRLPVGATLVRDSAPLAEAAETRAKAAGLLAALGVVPRRTPVGGGAPRLANDARVRARLAGRRSRLAPFWLRMRTEEPPVTEAEPALLVDAEDGFTAMLAHLLRVSGRRVRVVRDDTPDLERLALEHPGPVVLGPGPGDPLELEDPRMARLRAVAAGLLAARTTGGPPVLGVCLGHELLAVELGLPLVRRERPYQGAQERVRLFGRERTVGFYNSFTARCSDEEERALRRRGVELARDPDTGEVHALRGPGLAGTQFHPESVLTLEGAEVVRELLEGVRV
ncbi:anthranilate synthase family protein [Streptomyces sp. NPDC005438]|uniref:anthranilate synthase family protein n=1 Tax=Streptomyces sp. NPDC005438 TaxID=3156880 RepID=UPI0033A49E1A